MHNSSPQSNRRFMDFAPRGKRPAPVAPARPAPRPAPRPAARPVAPRPPHRPPHHPAPHPTHVRPAPRPASRPPLARPKARVVHEHVESTTILYPSSQSNRRLVEEDEFLDIETSGLGIIEDLDTPRTPSPHASSEHHSPFINTDKIDKRPLSHHLPTEQPSGKSDKRLPLLPKREKPSATSSQREKSSKLPKISLPKLKKPPKAPKPTKIANPAVVTGAASKGNTVALVIAIILTVIVGAVVGAIAYLAFFQG